MAYVVTDPGTAAVSGNYTEQIASLHDFFKPQDIPTLYARYGAQYMPMLAQFEALNRALPIQGDEWFGWEENWYHQTIVTSGTTTAGAAGAAVTITLAPSQVDADGNFYPQVGMIVSFPNSTYVQARIESIDTSAGVKMTIKPELSTDVIPATTDGETLVISSNAYGAGTDQPKGIVVGATKRSFTAQIFKTTHGLEGSQLTHAKWFNKIDDGRSVRNWYSDGYMLAEYQRDLFIDGAFTWGDEANNLTVPAGENGAGNKVKTTKGIMRHAIEAGHDLPYTAGSWSPEDLDAVGLYFLSQGITSGYSLDWVGAQLNIDIENGMKGYLNYTGVDYTNTVNNVFGGNKDLAASFGFKVIVKGGITHIIKPMPVWSHPKLFGASGYDMPKRGLFAPLAKVINPKNQEVMPNIAVRYEAMNGYNRKFEAWTVSGAGPGLKVIGTDKAETFLRSHMGLQVFKANQFVYTHA